MRPTHLKTLLPVTRRVGPLAARRIAAACGVGVLAFGSAACGSSDDPASANAQTGTQDSTQNQQGDQQGQFPGASGKVAAVADNTAQVQGQSGQVAVTWNGSTTFTKQVSAQLADVRVGTCVMVQSDDQTTGDLTTAPAAPTAITAATVRIAEAAEDGSCAGGFGGPGGGQRLRLNGNGQPPAGAPSGMPTDVPGGGTDRPQARAAFGGAFGEVTALSATGFTVTSSLPQLDGDGAASGSTPSMQETEVAVTVSGTTTYTTTGAGSADDVKVGSCLRAEGTADDTGAVTATTVAITPATNGECTGGFRRVGGATTQDS